MNGISRILGLTTPSLHQISTSSGQALEIANKILKPKSFNLLDLSTWLWRPSASTVQNKLHELEQELNTVISTKDNLNLEEGKTVAKIAVELEQLSALINANTTLKTTSVAGFLFFPEKPSSADLITRSKNLALRHLTIDHVKSYQETLIPRPNLKSSDPIQKKPTNTSVEKVIPDIALLKENLEENPNGDQVKIYESWKTKITPTITGSTSPETALTQTALLQSLKTHADMVVPGALVNPFEEKAIFAKLIATEDRNQISEKIHKFLRNIASIKDPSDRRILWSQFVSQITNKNSSCWTRSINSTEVENISTEVLKNAYVKDLSTKLKNNALKDKDNKLENLIKATPLQDRKAVLEKIDDIATELKTKPSQLTENWNSILQKIEPDQGLGGLNTAYETFKTEKASPQISHQQQLELNGLQNSIKTALKPICLDAEGKEDLSLDLTKKLKGPRGVIGNTEVDFKDKVAILNLGLKAAQALKSWTRANLNNPGAIALSRRTQWNLIIEEMNKTNDVDVVERSISKMFSNLNPPISNWNKTVRR